MKWVGRGAAFGAGMMLGPAIFWALLILAAAIVLTVITHLWLLFVPIVFFVIAVPVAIYQAWLTQEEEDRGKSESLAQGQRLHLHLGSHRSVSDPGCRYCTNRAEGRPIYMDDSV